MESLNTLANSGRWLIGWARKLLRPVRNRRDHEPATPEEEGREVTVLATICALADPRCPGSNAILELIQEMRRQQEGALQEQLASSPPRPTGPAYSAFDEAITHWIREDGLTFRRAWALAQDVWDHDKWLNTDSK